ncbi:hypothetical protein K457DRAFT_1816572 [Linnemannia elongata AG-77]|uniref:Uncharacterized protein n=1 Tax=Linnemannia elongata AG-77 TaxID=1314771 RepID=A0A197K6I4_9FUNG|nr:hypothetical protein K457DRAFT_1816572 [Linnemannia elongata AG-77]
MRKDDGGSSLLQRDIQGLQDKVTPLEKDALQLSSDQNHCRRNQHHSSTKSSSGTGPSTTHSSTVAQVDDSVLLWQEIYRLREQLAVKDQEKKEPIEAVSEYPL